MTDTPAPGPKRALVIGASGGLGAALAQALTARGVDVSRLSRRDDGLDITSATAVSAAADTIAPGLDLVIVATGALTIDGVGPEKAFAQLDPVAMRRAFEVNAIGPALLLKHFAPKLVADRRAVFMLLSARLGSIGDNRLGGWMSYRASKAALNQFMRCASVEFSRRHPERIFVTMHPGTVQTAMTDGYARRFTASRPDAASQLLAVIDGLTPADNGGFFAYDGQPIVW